MAILEVFKLRLESRGSYTSEIAHLFKGCDSGPRALLPGAKLVLADDLKSPVRLLDSRTEAFGYHALEMGTERRLASAGKAN